MTLKYAHDKGPTRVQMECAVRILADAGKVHFKDIEKMSDKALLLHFFYLAADMKELFAMHGKVAPGARLDRINSRRDSVHRDTCAASRGVV